MRIRLPFSGGRLALLALASLVALPSCGGGGGGGGGNEPASPFFVSAIEPEEDESGVSTSAHVRVTFSLSVAPTSITPTSVQVGSPGNGNVAGALTVVPDGTGRTLELAPNLPMEVDTTYVVLVSATLRSTAGDALGGKTSFLFRTGGSKPVIPLATQLRAANEPLEQGRRMHTATLLADGRVLVCGGFIQNGSTAVTDRAELFTPFGETFTTLAARMRKPRAGHTATRLADGRVLLVGGYTEISPGTLNGESSAEIYDPATSTFSDADSMTVPRFDHAALRLPDGRVVVTGGSELVAGLLSDHDTCEVYDPATDTWGAWPSMNLFRATHAMVDLLDGRWLLVGGSIGDFRPEFMDTTSGVFTPFAPEAQAKERFGVAAARFTSGNVSVIGGDGVGDVLYFQRATTQLLNTGSGTTVPRAYATASRIGAARILVAGGIDSSTGLVRSTCDLVVEGGVAGSETFATPVRFPVGIAQHTATVLADGRVLYAGGLRTSPGQPELTGAYIFTP